MITTTDTVFGWDIGGVNLKAARVDGAAVTSAVTRPFEIQRAPDALAMTIADLAASLGATPRSHHAVTMTAELSQCFRSKREGVAFVLETLAGAFPEAEGRVAIFATDGRFLTPDAARAAPLDVAAANWSATALLVAQRWPDAVLIDTGSTTTDITPIERGSVASQSRTDLDRLRAGELVYLGALRTPVEAVVQEVPVPGGWAGVSAEGFAILGDVHLWIGRIAAEEYAAPTPDGRPATREFAGERLARVVCADRSMLGDAAIDRLAHHIAARAVSRVGAALERQLAAHPSLGRAVIAGAGAFLARAAAEQSGLEPVMLSSILGDAAARAAPAAAVALLYAGSCGAGPQPTDSAPA